MISAMSGALRRNRFRGDHADVTAVQAAALFESNLAIRSREQRVIAAEADVFARVKLGAALPNENVARPYHLTTELLQPEALGVGITAVAGAAACFLVCNCLDS